MRSTTGFRPSALSSSNYSSGEYYSDRMCLATMTECAVRDERAMFSCASAQPSAAPQPRQRSSCFGLIRTAHADTVDELTPMEGFRAAPRSIVYGRAASAVYHYGGAQALNAACPTRLPPSCGAVGSPTGSVGGLSSNGSCFGSPVAPFTPAVHCGGGGGLTFSDCDADAPAVPSYLVVDCSRPQRDAAHPSRAYLQYEDDAEDAFESYAVDVAFSSNGDAVKLRPPTEDPPEVLPPPTWNTTEPATRYDVKAAADDKAAPADAQVIVQLETPEEAKSRRHWCAGCTWCPLRAILGDRCKCGRCQRLREQQEKDKAAEEAKKAKEKLEEGATSAASAASHGAKAASNAVKRAPEAARRAPTSAAPSDDATTAAGDRAAAARRQQAASSAAPSRPTFSQPHVFHVTSENVFGKQRSSCCC